MSGPAGHGAASPGHNPLPVPSAEGQVPMCRGKPLIGRFWGFKIGMTPAACLAGDELEARVPPRQLPLLRRGQMPEETGAPEPLAGIRGGSLEPNSIPLPDALEGRHGHAVGVPSWHPAGGCDWKDPPFSHFKRRNFSLGHLCRADTEPVSSLPPGPTPIGSSGKATPMRPRRERPERPWLRTPKWVFAPVLAWGGCRCRRGHSPWRPGRGSSRLPCGRA